MLERFLLPLVVPLQDPAPTPPGGLGNISAAAPPAVDAKVHTILSWMKWGGMVAGFIGLVLCGIMMMIGRRNRSATAVDGANGVPWVLAGLTLIAGATTLVGTFLA